MRTTLAFFFLAAFAGCPGNLTSKDAGIDGGTTLQRPDAGSSSDAGSDAGSISDAGSDAGPDAGSEGDAGTDAGPPRPPVGMPVPGCADASDPSLTANERFLLAMPADSWAFAPNSKLYDTCRHASVYGDGVYLVTGCIAIVDSWGGGAYDSQRQKLVVWGGGHDDYGGNELYAFNMKTFAWEQLTTPSRPPFGKDPLDDGNPVSRHTYDGVEFIASRGTILGFAGARSRDGNGTDLTWEFEPTSKVWTNLGPSAPPVSSLYDIALAYDRVTNKVYIHGHAYLGAYDFQANTWSRLSDFGYPPYTNVYDSWKTRVGAVDPVKRLFVTMGSESAVLVYNIDTAAVLSLAAPWNALTTSQAFLRVPAPGLDFDVATSQLVAWAGGSPMALDTSAMPYQWVARSALQAPVTANPRGTYGRWRYAERYNVFVLVNDANDDVRFYKHTTGCGR